MLYPIFLIAAITSPLWITWIIVSIVNFDHNRSWNAQLKERLGRKADCDWRE
jgi:hypothetical protein